MSLLFLRKRGKIITTFNELQLSNECLKAVGELGYVAPTLIQEKAIPALMSGRDVLGKSNTGTGKTAAFVIPATEMIKEHENSAKVLVLSPTRELAMQTYAETEKIARYKQHVKAAIVVGGKSIKDQTSALKHANIVIGTPGRIMDHIRRGSLKLSSIEMAVLDEADEMLNMGFYEDISEILSKAPENAQMALFSATVPAAIRKIADKFLSDPLVIEPVGTNRTLDKIGQAYYMSPKGKKTEVLKLILSEQKNIRTIVFCNTKSMVDRLSEELKGENRHVGALHGDMSQSERTKVMDGFKSGKYDTLIATDVAARGIDVDELDVVVNFDLPQNNEYYIHRIGRTGRAGKSGLALSIVGNSSQERELKDIIKYVGCRIERRELPSVKVIKQRREEILAQKIREEAAGGSEVSFANTLSILNDEGLSDKQIAAALLNILTKKENLDIKETFFADKPSRENLKNNGDTVKLRIDAGRNENMAPNFILAALTDKGGVNGSDIGKIDILKTCTIVAVSENAAKELMKSSSIKIRSGSYDIRLANAKDTEAAEARNGAKHQKGKVFKGKRNTGRGRYDKKSA